MASILIVDDDPDVLEVLEYAVKLTGHQVIKATGGDDALKILDGDQPVDLILTDIVMPGLNGFNLALMAKERRPSLRVLYLTGYFETAQVMRESGKHLGKLLRKPIMPEDLQREVEAALLSNPS